VAILAYPLLLFFWLFVAAVVPLKRLAKRYRIDARRELLRDGRDPILYLRSFTDDYEENTRRRDRKTDEELLISVLRSGGPVVAVGEPGGEGRPIPGAMRIYLEGRDWQAEVRELMSVSQLVVINANISKGLGWEIENARAMLEPQRLLISFLSWQGQDQDVRRRLYGRFRQHAERSLRCRMPASLGDACFMYFEPGWEPGFVRIGVWKKLLFGGVVPLSFMATSLFSLKITAGAIRESLRPVLRRCGIRPGVMGSLIDIAKTVLMAATCIILAKYFDGVCWGIFTVLLVLLLYTTIGRVATRDTAVNLYLTGPERQREDELNPSAPGKTEGEMKE
jgi:hypothetical protein